MISTFVAVMIVLSNPAVDRRVHLDIFGGHNCPAIEFRPTKECVPDFAAQLVVDGKVFGTIPLDALSPKEIEVLRERVGKIRFTE